MEIKRLHLSHFVRNISGLDEVRQPDVSFMYYKGGEVHQADTFGHQKQKTFSCSPSTKSGTVWHQLWKRVLVANALCVYSATPWRPSASTSVAAERSGGGNFPCKGEVS